MEVQLEELDIIDQEILRLKYINRKLTLTEIGKLLTKPMSPQAVSLRINKPKFKAYWEQLERDVIWEIKNAQQRAMQIILKSLNSNDERLAFQAAKTLIDPILQNCPQLLPEILNEEILEFEVIDADSRRIE